MAYDEDLALRIRELMAGQPGLVEKQMFGGVGFMLHGNLACGVNGTDLIVRVGPDAYEEAVIRPGARPFDLTGRPMKGWLLVELVGHETDRQLKEWVEQGVSFALSLPPK